jgi:hypothetical protein
MPRAQSVPLPTRPSLPWDPSPPSYADIARRASNLKDPNLRIPKIEAKVLSPRKRNEPLPQGRYLPPMAPLAAQLAPPPHSTSPSTPPTIIDLTEEPSPPTIIDLTEEPSTPNKKESRENQAEPKLKCRFGGRMTTRGHIMQTRDSKRAVPVGAKYKHSVGLRKGTGIFKHDRTLPVQSPYPPGMAKTPQV